MEHRRLTDLRVRLVILDLMVEAALWQIRDILARQEEPDQQEILGKLGQQVKLGKPDQPGQQVFPAPQGRLGIPDSQGTQEKLVKLVRLVTLGRLDFPDQLGEPVLSAFQGQLEIRDQQDQQDQSEWTDTKQTPAHQDILDQLVHPVQLEKMLRRRLLDSKVRPEVREKQDHEVKMADWIKLE
jgi:hypothetical protein